MLSYSELPLQADAIPATAQRRQNGDVVRMVQGHCVMPAVYVCLSL
jgi:hypothetical protein